MFLRRRTSPPHTRVPYCSFCGRGNASVVGQSTAKAPPAAGRFFLRLPAIGQCVLPRLAGFPRPQSPRDVLAELGRDRPKDFALGVVAASQVQRRASANNWRFASSQSDSASPGNANLRRRSEMKYARRRIVSSASSTDSDGSVCGDAEICVDRTAVSFVTFGLRAFLAVVARRPP
jgi:hypothetical protein